MNEEVFLLFKQLNSIIEEEKSVLTEKTSFFGIAILLFTKGFGEKLFARQEFYFIF